MPYKQLDPETEKEINRICSIDIYLERKAEEREEKIDSLLAKIKMLELDISFYVKNFDNLSKNDKDEKILNKISVGIGRKRKEKEKEKEKHQQLIKAQKLKSQFDFLYTKCENIICELIECDSQSNFSNSLDEMEELTYQLHKVRIKLLRLERKIERRG